MYSKQTGLALVCLTAVLMSSVGCTNTPLTLGTEEHYALLKQDQEGFASAEEKTLKLTMAEALDRAVRANLDGRVAEMELLVQQKNVTLKELEALPSLTYSRGIKRRSNDGASSSRSVLSGLESLEPSQSSDKYRLVTEAAVNWDMIDAAITFAEAERMNDEAKIVGERYAKVIQNIERDVYAAYWRAWGYQQTHGGSNSALASARQQLANLETAREKNYLSDDDAGNRIADITDRMRTLEDVSDSLSLSQTELKTLLSLPQSTKLELERPPSQDKEMKDLLRTDTVDQEWQALKDRPEMREEVLQKNVAIKNIHHEILKTFPGAELAFSYNNDTNSFLQNSDWSNFSMSLVQNILNVFTLPARYHAAEEKEKLADARRKALNAAIVAQVRLGKIRLSETRRSWVTASHSADAAYKKAVAKRSKAKTGFASGNDVTLASLDSQIEIVRRHLAEAQMQDSYAALVNSLGLSLGSDEPLTKKEAK